MRTILLLSGSILLISIVFFLLLFAHAGEPKADFAFQGGNEPRTLDPGYITGLNEGRLASALFEGLINLDPETNTPIPGVAQTWEISPDGKTYTFYLRKDAYWVQKHQRLHPLNADDFVYSWFRILEHKIPCDYAFQFFYIKNAEAYYHSTRKQELEERKKTSNLSSDEQEELDHLTQIVPHRITRDQVGINKVNTHTLQIELEAPTPYFLELLGFWVFFPVPQDAIEQHGLSWTRAENLMTNGAFYIKKHQLNYKIRLGKNSYYWNHDLVQLDHVDSYLITSHQTAFNLFISGELDWINECPPLFLDTVKEYIQAGEWSAEYITTKLATFFLRFNCSQPPFSDPKVRKAFSLCIDRNEWVEKVTGFYETPAQGFVPPLQDFPQIQVLETNKTRARDLLTQAGYPNGQGFPAITFLYNSNETYERYAAVLQRLWHDTLNIRVELINKPWKGYIQSRKGLEYHICFSNWIGDYGDPMTFLDMYTQNSGNNQTGWKDIFYDQCIALAKNLSPLLKSNLPDAPESVQTFYTHWKHWLQALSETEPAHYTEIKKSWEQFNVWIDQYKQNSNHASNDAMEDNVFAEKQLVCYSKIRMALLALTESYLIIQGAPIAPIFHDVNKNFVSDTVTGFYPNIQNMHPLWAIHKSVP